MMTGSLKFDQWSVMSGFWDDGTKVVCPSAVIIKKAGNDDGLNQGPSMNQSNHLFRILSMNG